MPDTIVGHSNRNVSRPAFLKQSPGLWRCYWVSACLEAVGVCLGLPPFYAYKASAQSGGLFSIVAGLAYSKGHDMMQ
jgi:hypothetical protein